MPASPITKVFALVLGAAAFSAAAFAHMPRRLADGFVRLSQTDPGIAQDMRYATRNNVLGRPLAGYRAVSCILRERTAKALAKVQSALEPQGFGLMVFDCYRPKRAVRDLVGYSRNQAKPSAPYHPNIDGPSLLSQGYVAERSGHSTGLAVDLTLIHLGNRKASTSRPECGGPWSSQEVDMGTGFDCFDPQAGDAAALTAEQTRHRSILRGAMTAAGFAPYSAEWWHFSLPPRNDAERRAMDFDVR